jgi:glycosyltransferase involved in cell wall biosynthesis
VAPSSTTSLAVVLPAWNLGKVIAQNIERVQRALSGLGEVELVVVDDGSADDTLAEAMRVAASSPSIRVLRHESNRGKGEALFTGARATTSALVVFLDADLDLPPEQVPSLVDQMNGIDLLVGAKRSAMGEGRYPLPRRLMSRLFASLTVGLFRLPVRETQTGLKVLRRSIIDSILPQMRIHGYAYDLEMLVRAHRGGFQIREVPVELGPTASQAPVRLAMMWQLGRDTLRLGWWTLSRRIPRQSHPMRASDDLPIPES